MQQRLFLSVLRHLSCLHPELLVQVLAERESGLCSCSYDAEQDWNQLAFPLSTAVKCYRCQGKKNGAELEVGSEFLLYIFRSLQSIIRFDIWRISMQYTENIKGIFYSQSYNYKLRCFFAFYVYVVSIWPIEYYRLKVAFYLASQNQMIINGYKKKYVMVL